MKLTEQKLDQVTRLVAKTIWESKGRPKGEDEAIWLEAEKGVACACRIGISMFARRHGRCPFGNDTFYFDLSRIFEPQQGDKHENKD